MASIVYNSMLEDLSKGLIDFSLDSFKCLLVSSSYQASKDDHAKRSDITNEISGAGYSSGGKIVVASVTKNNISNKVSVGFSNPSWSDSTISASGAVIYKNRGGSASSDELIAFIDLGETVSSTDGVFTIIFSSALEFLN